MLIYSDIFNDSKMVIDDDIGFMDNIYWNCYSDFGGDMVNDWLN
jgi:hypothetical protein